MCAELLARKLLTRLGWFAGMEYLDREPDVAPRASPKRRMRRLVGSLPRLKGQSSQRDWAPRPSGDPHGRRVIGTRLHRCACQPLVLDTSSPKLMRLRTRSNDAAVRWPGLSRAKLLVRLAMEGHRATQQIDGERRGRRLAALDRHSGVFTGAYGPD